ncbi:centromere protein K isoform X1 [Polypterus senegalus]|uniref:centromere protein K isoform X1 n=1 Tax=Polypterus senegalus TaxID=55291 RepID=UPI001962C046|nr:centromere protein K isoform X1 [Polypterus senegalus]
MDAMEVLQQAKALANAMTLYQETLPPDLTTELEFLASAKEELFNECEEKWKEIEELQSKLALTETEACADPELQTTYQHKAMMAELHYLEEKEPHLISENGDVLAAFSMDELQRVNRELEMVLSCCQAQNENLKKTLNREQEWLQEQQELGQVIAERAAKVKSILQDYSEARALQDMKVKIQQVKVYQENLLNSMGTFLAQHFPLPQHQKHPSKKTKMSIDVHENVISLHEILETLMNKILEMPHDPYVTIDDTFWPPYIEMLLRFGIVLRHPENPNKIRMEAFHQ